MEAGTLRCPGCGAAARTDEPACAHCGARLATVACPSCFGMIFAGTRHCPHCGARAERSEVPDAAPLDCPRCRAPLAAVQVGTAALGECDRCGGVWLAAADFQRMAANREQQTAVLGFRAPPATPTPLEAQVRYGPCPVCGQMMNRVNFAKISGIVIDQCRDHGAWFDRDELRRIVEFIRAGGLDRARERERLWLEEARRAAEQAQRAAMSGAEPFGRTRVYRREYVGGAGPGGSLWDDIAKLLWPK
ncbi:MAG TPA: zf-TFIIB domain-containing protein [Longimicrobium sp.]|nr:zf-TFIIB domain-containing protein [Longimicrobium sp.]